MFKKIITSIALFSLMVLAMPSPAGAVEATTTQSSELTSLLEVIATLQQQIADLQVKITELKKIQAQVKEEGQEIQATLKLARQLVRGMSGEDVKLLQEMLATDPEIYPEGLITGYFGFLTEKAVKKFQAKMGVEQVGNVGPKTVSKINELLAEGAGKSGKVPPGLLISPGIKKKLGYNPVVPEGQSLPYGIAKKLGLATTTPGDDDADDVDDDDASTSTPTSTPDITAPLISEIEATSVKATSSVILWLTDEMAISQVYYGTSTPLDIATTTVASVSDSTLVLEHSITLPDLIASTTYYYVVSSTDETGNEATSTEQSLATE